MRRASIVVVILGLASEGHAEVPDDLRASTDVLFPASGPILHDALKPELDNVRWKRDSRFSISLFGDGYESIVFPSGSMTREQLVAHLESIWGPPVVHGTQLEKKWFWVSTAKGVRAMVASNTFPPTITLTEFLPVEKLLGAGPSLAADRLRLPGTPVDEIWQTKQLRIVFDGTPRWAQAPQLRRTDWENWPGDTRVEVHIDKSGRLDGYRLEIPYEHHPPFAQQVRELMTKAWGKPAKRGKKLMFTGKAGTATALDNGVAWELELMVKLPKPKR
ncbi:MAG: hypothetical protein H0T46_07295 [Deltaproteobacteria bacterium]|nr:hypothetical protein [Deltaproteobacteria bacterium]